MNPQEYGTVSGSNLNGKYLYFIDKAHPLSHQCGRVYVHRHNASIKMGRWLKLFEHVHHINGNPMDNSMDNLIVLSNAEHSKKHHPPLQEVECPICQRMFTPVGKQRFCSQSCSQFASRKRERPSKDIILEDVKALGFKGASRKYGVSDNAIRKWLK